MGKTRGFADRPQETERHQLSVQKMISQLHSFLEDLERLKHRLLGFLAVITVLLAGYSLARHDFPGLYVLTLSSVSATLIISVLPRLRLGVTAAYLFVMPIFVYSGVTWFMAAKVIFSLLVISLLIVMWIVAILLERDARLNVTRLFWPALALIAATFLSLINAKAFWGDFESVGLLCYFLIFALLVANTIKSRRDLHLLVGALLFSGVLASLIGILQFYGVTAPIPAGVAPELLAVSTFGNKNYLAGFLAYLFVLGLLLLLDKTHWAIRSLVLPALAILYLGLMITNSYSAWLAVTVGLLILLVGLWLYQRNSVPQGHWFWSLLLVVLLVVMVLCYSWTTVHWVQVAQSTSASFRSVLIHTVPGWGSLLFLALIGLLDWLSPLTAKASLRQKYIVLAVMAVTAIGLGIIGMHSKSSAILSPITEKLSAVESVEWRAEAWQIGYLMFRDHPITGIGIGEYKRQYLPYKGQYLQTPEGQALQARIGYVPGSDRAHNEYIQLAAEMGLVGILTGAFFILTIFWSALRRLRISESIDAKLPTLVLIASVISFMSDSLLGFPLHLPPNALVFSFLLGALFTRTLGAQPLEVRFNPLVKRVLAGGLVTIVAITVILGYRTILSEMLFERAKVEYQLLDYQQALSDLQRSVSLDIEPAENLFWLAQLEQTQGNTVKAQSDYVRSLQSFNTEESYYRLALVYVQSQDYRAATTVLDQLLAMHPASKLQIEAEYLRALVAVNQNDWQTALTLLNDLITRNPDDERPYIPLGQHQLTQKQYDAARATLTHTLALIQGKLSDVSQKLASAVGHNVSFQEYTQAKNDQVRLQKEEETAKQLLDSIPAGQ